MTHVECDCFRVHIQVTRRGRLGASRTVWRLGVKYQSSVLMPVLWHVTLYCRLYGSRRGAFIVEGHNPATEPVLAFSVYQYSDGAEGRTVFVTKSGLLRASPSVATDWHMCGYSVMRMWRICTVRVI